MSDRVQIQITATDGASRVFQQVSTGAERMADSFEKAGLDATKFRDRMEMAARQAADSNQKYAESDKIMRDLGISAGLLATGMALAGSSFRDQEVALRTLERGYGDAAAEMEAFAEQIQSTTNFSNDAAIAAANTFRTLSDNYGFTTDQIQQLISISADLAATMGISLSDAAFRVQSAMRGEAEAAEFLGLTLNDRALGLDKVSTSMSEAERAQIRFNALQEQSAFALGTAAEQADTTYGSMTQLRDGVQDAAQAFGEFLGPVGEIGAFAADNAVQIAAMGLALGQLAKTGSSLKTLATEMGGVTNAAKGLAASIGPGGLLIGGVVAAELAFLGLKKVLATDLGAGADEAEASIQRIIDKLIALDDQTKLTATQQALAQQIRAAKELMMERDELLDAEGKAYAELTDIQLQYYDVNKDGTTTLDEYTLAEKDVIAVLEERKQQADALTAIEEELNQAQFATGAGAEQYQQTMTAITQSIIAGNLEKAEAVRLANEAQKAFEDEQLAVTLAGDGWVHMGDMMVYVGEATEDTTRAINANTQTLGTWVDAAGNVVTLNDDIAKSMQELGQQSVELGDILVRSTDPFILRQSEMLNGIQAQMVAMGNLSTRLAGIEGPSTDAQGAQDLQGIIQGARAAQDGLAVSIENAAAAMTYQVGESARLAAELEQQAQAVAELQAQYAETFEQMQADATRASDTLETVFGAIVGNTDAIAKQSQEVADWSAGLADATEHMDEWGNSLGWWSVLDDLVYDATISQQDYNAAVEANTDIQAANASIQRDVLSIQAQLAPVIATATEALAAQMDEIANGSTDAQLFALGMMDAATSSQALALAQGYLENQDVFGSMIQQAAELNPMLAQILEEMGLISYNPATGTVELLGADEAISDLDRLTEAIDRLTMVQWMVMLDADATEAEAAFEAATGQAVDWDNQEPEAQLMVDTSQATAGLADVNVQLDGWDSDVGTADANIDPSDALAGLSTVGAGLAAWDGSSGTASANVADNASGTLYNISALLNSLDGRSVTSYATVIQQTIGGGAIFGHGGVAGYASGGVVAEMAEWGPELLHFPTGGVALARDRGVYTVPVGTYVDTAPATAHKLGGGPTFQFVNNGTIIGIDDLEATIAETISRAWVRGNRQHEQSMGAAWS